MVPTDIHTALIAIGCVPSGEVASEEGAASTPPSAGAIEYAWRGLFIDVIAVSMFDSVVVHGQAAAAGGERVTRSLMLTSAQYAAESPALRRHLETHLLSFLVNGGKSPPTLSPQLDGLSESLMVSVLSYLDLRSVMRVSLVSRGLMASSFDSEPVWRVLVERDVPTSTEPGGEGAGEGAGASQLERAAALRNRYALFYKERLQERAQRVAAARFQPHPAGLFPPPPWLLPPSPPNPFFGPLFQPRGGMPGGLGPMPGLLDIVRPGLTGPPGGPMVPPRSGGFGAGLPRRRDARF